MKRSRSNVLNYSSPPKANRHTPNPTPTKDISRQFSTSSIRSGASSDSSTPVKHDVEPQVLRILSDYKEQKGTKNPTAKSYIYSAVDEHGKLFIVNTMKADVALMIKKDHVYTFTGCKPYAMDYLTLNGHQSIVVALELHFCNQIVEKSVISSDFPTAYNNFYPIHELLRDRRHGSFVSVRFRVVSEDDIIQQKAASGNKTYANKFMRIADTTDNVTFNLFGTDVEKFPLNQNDTYEIYAAQVFNMESLPEHFKLQMHWNSVIVNRGNVLQLDDLNKDPPTPNTVIGTVEGISDLFVYESCNKCGSNDISTPSTTVFKCNNCRAAGLQKNLVDVAKCDIAFSDNNTYHLPTKAFYTMFDKDHMQIQTELAEKDIDYEDMATHLFMSIIENEYKLTLSGRKNEIVSIEHIRPPSNNTPPPPTTTEHTDESTTAEVAQTVSVSTTAADDAKAAEAKTAKLAEKLKKKHKSPK